MAEEEMKALKELEKLQSMISFMEDRDLSSHRQDSDRFLSEFMLFMAKPCGKVTMEEKWQLVSQHLLKISPPVLEEAASCLTGENYSKNFTKRPTNFDLENKRNLDLLGTDVDDMAMVGLDAMLRANSTLEDFCRFYFMFHGLDAKSPALVFKYLPVLSFVESYIYQLDSFNELISDMGVAEVMHGASKRERDQNLKDRYLKVFSNGPFRPLVLLLERRGLLTERIKAELNSGEEYWLLERKLCDAVVSKQEILLDDVMRAIHLKSFDYRVLNLLLYQLRGAQVNDIHMEFLSVSEFLVEVSDDLFDYEDDVVENNFNILRMFIGVYGASVAPIMLARCITEAEEKYESLSKVLDDNLSSNCWKRCEEATKEGGKISGHCFGTWNIPTVIADEELYRSEILRSNQQPSQQID